LRAEALIQAGSHPLLVSYQIYKSFLRDGVPGVGYGGLLSVVLDEQLLSPVTFYDSLDVYKGPSLGTNFTLVCPYTLLVIKHTSFAKMSSLRKFFDILSVALA